MKVLFVLENTIKSLEGGTEVSSFHLAGLLRGQKIDVEEWAPYSKRMPIYFYTGIFFQIVIFLLLLWTCVKNRPQILHIQGKYLLPQVVLVGKLLRIPTVATIRDYIVVCPIGLCLFDFHTNHGFLFFFFHEIPKFLSIYHRNDNLIIRIIRYIFLTRGWLVTQWLRFWLKRADAVVSVSEAVKKILSYNGISSKVIHNAFDPEVLKNLSAERLSIIHHPSSILFAGKPSYGKGYDLFQSLSRNKLFRDFRFVTIGGSNKLPYLETLQKIREAVAVVVPSRWPEPFGRVALEALMMGTPVVASKCGGLPEIVENGKTGIITELTIGDMADALRLIIKQNNKFREEIMTRKKLLIKKFESIPLRSHINLYSILLAKIG